MIKITTVPNTSRADYVLIDGTELHGSNVNGNNYTLKTSRNGVKLEETYTPVTEWDGEQWLVIGFTCKSSVIGYYIE